MLQLVLLLLLGAPPQNAKDELSKAFMVYSGKYEINPRIKSNRGAMKSMLEGKKKAFLDEYQNGAMNITIMNVRLFEKGAIGLVPIITIVQIIDEHKMLARVENVYFMVNGFNTNGLVNGEKIQLNAPQEVMGTETYNTVGGGSNTVWSISLADKTKWRSSISHSLKWYDNKNRVLVVGEFLKIETGYAVFKTDQGEEKFRISRMNAGDREIIQWLSK